MPASPVNRIMIIASGWWDNPSQSEARVANGFQYFILPLTPLIEVRVSSFLIRRLPCFYLSYLPTTSLPSYFLVGVFLLTDRGPGPWPTLWNLEEGDSLAEEVKKSISEARGGQDGWEEEEGRAGDASVRCDPRSVCEPERRYGTRNQLVTLPSWERLWELNFKLASCQRRPLRQDHLRFFSEMWHLSIPKR